MKKLFIHSHQNGLPVLKTNSTQNNVSARQQKINNSRFQVTGFPNYAEKHFVKSITKQKIRLTIIFCLLLGCTFASNNAGAFLEYEINAKNSALGNSGVTLLGQSEAIFLNPAKLPLIKNQDFKSMFSNAFEAKYQAISGMINLWGLNWGIGYLNAGVDDITDSHWDSSIKRYILSGKNFNYKDQAIYLGTGLKISDQINIGLSVKGIQTDAAKYRATGLGADLGFLATLNKDISLGLVVENIVQPEMRWNTPSNNIDTIPRIIKMGLTLQILKKTSLVYESKTKQNRKTTHHLGLEYKLLPILALRAGYDNGKITLGTGLKLYLLELNFAWRETELDVLEPTYKFGLGLIF